MQTKKLVKKLAKILTLALCAVFFAAAFSACSQSGSENSQDALLDETSSGSNAQVSGADDNSSSEDGKVYKIGLIQLAENGSFTDMREGFINRLNELGYEGKTEIDYKNAQGDVGTLNTIASEMASSDKDIVVTIATPAAQAYVSQESEIPLIFISVSDPVAAGIMSSLDSPDRNATGSSNLVPVGEIFELSKKLTPDVNKFGFLYNTGEANAVVTVEKAKQYLDQNDYAYDEATVTNTSEIQQAAQSLVSKVDALFIPIDSSIQSAMVQVAQIAVDAGIPVYSSAPVMVADGALATVSIDDAEVGAAAADIADKYFNGTAIKDIPADTIDNFMAVINQNTADALGITIPENIAERVLVISDSSQTE